MKFYIYLLTRDGEAEPFYIGLTTNPKQRRQQHRSSWSDASIQLQVIETHLSMTKASEREGALIREHRKNGTELLNWPLPARFGPRATTKALKEGARSRQDADADLKKKWLTNLVETPEFKALAKRICGGLD